MLVELDRESLPRVRNPVLRAYAGRYVQIAEEFRQQVEQTGIEFEQAQGLPDPTGEPSQPDAETVRRLLLPGVPHGLASALAALQAKGAVVRNGGRSLYSRWISPACLACRTGQGSATFFLSLQCHRQCFYCFNPNQEEYARYRQETRDAVAELDQRARSGERLDHVALTGGEPLLHREEAVAFFRAARERYPGVYTRLYTSGDLVDEPILQQLQEAGLQEIRFSIRLMDGLQAQEKTLDRIRLARRHLPVVMVEMPVLPEAYDRMTEILVELDRIGADGINLLELCYPFHNAAEFRRRGYRVKAKPFRVLYNYWYAGGLPVAGSEATCLRLVDFALDRGLKLGVHYCSLENKHTAQILRQDTAIDPPAHHVLSPQDHFLKSAKAFGDEVPRVIGALRRAGVWSYTVDSQRGYVEFPVSAVGHLAGLDVEVAISTKVVEADDEGYLLRELKLELADPASFDPERDI